MTRLFAPAFFGCSMLTACGGTETGNPAAPAGPLSHFESTACKTEAPTSQSSPGQTEQALVTTSDFDGLQCIEWERGSKEGDLTLRLINFPGGCTVKWDGAAAQRNDGSLELELVNTGCTLFRCGSCLYDTRYDLSGIAGTPLLALHIGYVDCPSKASVRWEYDTSLAIGATPTGIVCRYAPLNSVLSPTVCSGKNLLCGGASGLCNSTPCADGLTCTPVDGVNDSRCLQPCTTNADCTPAGTMACTDGVCRLATTW